MSDSATAVMTVTFASHLSRGDCVKRLGRVGNPIINGIGHQFTVGVRDGTQADWARRYGMIAGVEQVQYDRPATIADN